MQNNKQLRLTVVVPTRNRASLAIRAIESVRKHGGGVGILVSENSTVQSERDAVLRYCEKFSIRCVQPPASMQMSAHWNWAFSQLGEYDYVTVLTDRMVFIPTALKDLIRVIQERPEISVISYNNDNVIDNDVYGVGIIQRPHTNQIYEFESNKLAEMTARAEICGVLPRMLNCLVHVDLMEKIKTSSGEYFSSNSPDFNFGYKVLGIVEKIHYLDSSLLLSCGASRSNGGNLSRGILNQDSSDFTSFKASEGLAHSPFPAVWMPTNAVVHEYELVRKQFNNAWPQADVLLWRNLLVKRAAGVNTQLGLAWKDALVNLYGASPTEFPPDAKTRSANLVEYAKGIIRPWLRLIYGWLPYKNGYRRFFKDENEAIEYMIEHPVPASTTISLNKDF